MWDPSTKAVTSPSAQIETSAIAEFEQQDWVERLMQDESKQDPKRTHVNLRR